MRKETDGGRGATHSWFIYFDPERDEDAIPDRDRSTAAKPHPAHDVHNRFSVARKNQDAGFGVVLDY